MSHEHATHHRAKFADHKPQQDAYSYEMETYQKGLTYERPPLTFQASKLESLACDRMSAESKGYVYGSAGSRETDDKNKAAFKKWSIAPNRLTGIKNFPDLTTEIFGEKLQAPIAMAPVGVLRIFNPEGEVAAAKAAAKEAMPYILSTASSTSIEDVTNANGEDGQMVSVVLAESKARRYHYLSAAAREEIGVHNAVRDTGYVLTGLASFRYG